MNKKGKRLGQGIDALFSANIEGDVDVSEVLGIVEDVSGYEVKEIDIQKLRPNPFQPRKDFDATTLDELAQSISEHGILQPIVVRKGEVGYDILAGERRFRAAKLAKIKKVPVVIKSFTDNAMMELGLLENIQRENLNIIEEAMGYRMLLEKLGMTQEILAKRMGKSRSHITNVLRLLQLPEEVQQLIIAKQLTMGHTKILVGLSPEKIQEFVEKIVTNKLSVREAEKLIHSQKKQTASPMKQNKETIQQHYIEEKLQQHFLTKVQLKDHKIVIHFEDTEDFGRILEILDVSLDGESEKIL